MDTQDRKAIDDLFGKLADVERQAGPRDAEAESFIAQQLSHQPGAPYYMAQTIVMQELALENQNREIEELRRQAASQPQGGGGLLGRLFGGGGQPQRPPQRHARPAMASAAAAGAAGAASGPWNSQQGVHQGGYGQQQPGYAQQQGRGGGGFLAGAAQTAMGVAGGVLLGNAVMGMFSGDEAVAAENPAAEPEPAVEDASMEDTGGDEGGGFFDSFGGGDDIEI